MASRFPFRPVKLGLAPTRRRLFDPHAPARCKKDIEDKLAEWNISFVNIDFLNEEGMLYDAADVPRVVEAFRREDVDAVFVPHCNFGAEDAAATLGKAMGLPYLLWGPRDEPAGPDGVRLRDTQCGLFATSKILRRLGAPFTYVVNSGVASPVFERGLKNFVSCAAALREFRKARIGQVAVRPQAFWTVMCNEGELLERFGVNVVATTLVEIVEAVKARLDAAPAELADEIAGMRSRADFSKWTDEQVAKVAALKLALLDWIRDEDLSAVALQCWPALQKALRIFPCFVNGEITGMGAPVACEMDIHGALTSIMLRAAALGSTPPFFADLTVRHPENDNAELLWHCGPFPLDLIAEGETPDITDNWMDPSPCPALGNWRIRGGEVTLARFDGDRGEYRLLLGHAMGVEGPRNRGNYLWVEVGDWPKWEETIIRGPYIHHVAGVHGRHAPALYEVCRYIEGLSPECVEPEEEEIRAFLRGADL